MATSCALSTALRSTLRWKRWRFTVSAIQQQQVAHMSDEKAPTQTHIPNFRRTHAEIAQALRSKKNYLSPETVDKHRHSILQSGTDSIEQVKSGASAPREYRYVMPEFLPRPQAEYRDRVLEKLERRDMMRRRTVISIPEFYVGSVMAVSLTDPHAPGSKNRFVGICIDRAGHGLKAYFVLRNVVEGLGVEVMYEMYSPNILSIEVLKLEKHVDEQLYYLRDALPQYSTIPFDMDPVQLPRGAAVPVNTEKVIMRPSREWEARWEIYNYAGIQPFELSKGRIRRHNRLARHFSPNDIVREYRGKINEDEESKIMAEVYKDNQFIESKRKAGRATLKRNK